MSSARINLLCLHVAGVLTASICSGQEASNAAASAQEVKAEADRVDAALTALRTMADALEQAEDDARSQRTKLQYRLRALERTTRTQRSGAATEPSPQANDPIIAAARDLQEAEVQSNALASGVRELKSHVGNAQREFRMVQSGLRGVDNHLQRQRLELVVRAVDSVAAKLPQCLAAIQAGNALTNEISILVQDIESRLQSCMENLERVDAQHAQTEKESRHREILVRLEREIERYYGSPVSDESIHEYVRMLIERISKMVQGNGKASVQKVDAFVLQAEPANFFSFQGYPRIYVTTGLLRGLSNEAQLVAALLRELEVQREGSPSFTQEEMLSWMEQLGYDPAQYLLAYDSIRKAKAVWQWATPRIEAAALHLGESDEEVSAICAALARLHSEFKPHWKYGFEVYRKRILGKL